MEKQHKELLIRRRCDLVDNLNVRDGLYTQLISRKVLNQRTVRTIKNDRTPDQQAEELLDIIPTRGPNAFQLFCDSLIADDQEHIVTEYLTTNIPTTSRTDADSTDSRKRKRSPSPETLQIKNTQDGNMVVKFLSQLKSEKCAENVPFSDGELRYSLKHFISQPGVEVLNTARYIPVPNRNQTPTIHHEQCSSPRTHPNARYPQQYSTPQNQPDVPQYSNSPNCREHVSSPGGHHEQYINPLAHSDPYSPKRLEQFVIPTRLSEHSAPRNYPDHCFIQTKYPEQCSEPSVGEKLLRADSVDAMQRLVRIDSTDTNRQNDDKNNNNNNESGGNGCISPDSDSFEDNDIDLTDGPVTNLVQQSSRQFYINTYKQAYPMRRIPRGKALIINVNEVKGKTARRGTDIDRDNLHYLLLQLHFDVTVYNDVNGLTAQELYKKIQQFAELQDHGKSDACFICLLSHGEEGFIYGTDGETVSLNNIFSLFDNSSCPLLRGKPKVFIIQACRGGSFDRGVSLDEPDGGPASSSQLPTLSDMIIGYPTQAGYYAWRNRERGSWYIEAIVHVFIKHAKHDDICTLLNRVNSVVSRKISRTQNKDMDQMSQMSEYKSSLRKPHLFLFPGIGSVIENLAS